MEARFLGGFVENVAAALADGGVVAETVEELAARGALRVLVQERDAEAMIWGRSGE